MVSSHGANDRRTTGACQIYETAGNERKKVTAGDIKHILISIFLYISLCGQLHMGRRKERVIIFYGESCNVMGKGGGCP